MKKIVFALLLLLIASGCGQQASQEGKQILFSLKVIDDQNKDVFEKQLDTKNGTNLFDALKDNNVEFEYKEYSFGVFITGIEGLSPAEGEYLAIYVDGKYSEKGATEIIPANNSEVGFRVEKVMA